MKIKGGKSKIHNIVDLDTTFNNEWHFGVTCSEINLDSTIIDAILLSSLSSGF
jgi:hypothetical protein